MHHHAPATEAPPIANRPESSGFWAKGWPVIALGIITLLLVRACIPSGVPAGPVAFDAAAATTAANERAMAALAAVTAETPLDVAVKALNMPTVNFASGSSEIPVDAKRVLTEAAAAIQVLPATARFEVAGHTDNTGTPEANMVLSRQRGQAIADFLVAAGVPRERVAAQGYGDTRPVAPNNNEEGRFRNRRIEIKPLGT
jgi:outer membrane protein OmpA-like peptidoglycan-associated protein